jgi:thiamine kinase-like enzyme
VDLYPSHGDAHPKNLLPSSKGWQWIDFEDVSLMPKFWDIASFIGNTALFHGLKHPMVAYVLNLKDIAADKQSFRFALKARAIMSITMNLSLALDGSDNLDFATSQLDRLDDFLSTIESKF